MAFSTEELNAAVAEATKLERERCLKIVRREYLRWRESDGEALVDFSIGAIGACANIFCAVHGLTGGDL